MNNKLKIAVAILAVALLTAGVTYAVLTWSGTRTWTYEDTNESFSLSNPTSLDYGNFIGGGQQVENFVVTNDGNVPVSVVVSASATGASAAWNATSATIPVGDSATFQLTLTITGPGSCTVDINKA